MQALKPRVDPMKWLVQIKSPRQRRRTQWWIRWPLFALILVSAGLYVQWTIVGSEVKSTAINGIDFPSLIDATVDDLVIGLDFGLFTSVDLVKAYVARINETQQTLNAVTEINPDALAIAAALDKEREDGLIRGPLHGIPILIKDNIGTMDQMNNTSGSYALLGAKLPTDATVITKLRKAGAIILGKVNLSEWAEARSFNSSSGWSAYGGQTYGAYHPQQDPSGSSSGSGVASSVGLALATLGTETAGSIINPSSYNNLVGIKPTVGLTSRYLVVPISEHQDTVGPLARTVKDAAYILQAIAGKDPEDNYTSAIPFENTPNYIQACDLSALKGKRIGVPRNAIEYSNNSYYVIEAFNAALTVLSDAGAIIVDNTNYTYFDFQDDIAAHGHKVIAGDFISGLARYFAELTYNPSGVASLESLLNYTKTHPLEEYPDRDVGVWERIVNEGTNSPSPEHWAAYQQVVQLLTSSSVPGAIQNHSLDALVIPSIFQTGNILSTAMLGLPTITVPLGAGPPGLPIQYNDRHDLVMKGPNVPFGISFLGNKFSEETLIGIAYAFEQRTKNRDKIQPYIKPRTELRDVILQTNTEMR